LFRHYWTGVKFLLTLCATSILLLHMRRVSQMSGVAATTTLSGADFSMLRIQLVVHAGGGLLVLLAATALSVYKPWGRTRYGRRKQHARREVSQPIPLQSASNGDTGVGADRATTTTPPWGSEHPGCPECSPRLFTRRR
jgi:hypothetical protein